jgi:ribonuclease J
MELRDRSHLANHGLVVVLLALNQESGAIVYGPELFTKGFVPEEESQDFLEEAKEVVRQLLAEHSLEAMTEWEELRVEVRKALRRFFNRTIQRRPLILPVVLEL